MPTACGVGACAATGTTSCVSGAVLDSCAPGTPAASDATCDGIDNDCSGAVDEDYVATPTACGVGACAATGTTSCVSGAVLDSCAPGTPAASDATCDGIDDDCSGAVDEDYVATPTACGVGACAATGTTSCVSGAVLDSCAPGTPAASDATCDGIDDDCSGAVDEDYVAVTSCFLPGACAARATCVVLQRRDGDGLPDRYAGGERRTCDGIDDDCSGAVDEDYASMPTACGVGACAATGTTSCVSGAVLDSCAPGTPAASDATCDGIDDDCSGAVDEDYASIPTACGVGACAATGTTSCVSGAVLDSCAPGTPAASDATCDGIDDDCSGAVDEDYASIPTACGVGACAATGTTSCVSGAVLDSCAPGTPAASDATCDGIDDDCSGAVDEDYASIPTACGVGACAATGTTSCVSGAVLDSCAPGTPAASDATCDGIDDDCSGAVDEDYASIPTACGVGACAATGTTSCVSGAVLDSCAPGTPAASDATCDGIDNDCSGAVDEDYVATPTACGVGACAATGTTSCVSGAVLDSCAPGTPAASDATCDGIDDDCSGAVDEDYVATPTACGVGACAATGTTSCVSGAVLDSCAPGTPAASDATCDGIDDDCSGAVDEDYVAVTSCFLPGACAAGNVPSSCSGGTETGCRTGTPAANDGSCDGIDNDCSGAVDEDYASIPTACGVGACAATGTTSCVSGAVLDSCAPGTPAASDATCDGIDDDCSGAVDEDYASIPTACGVGACAATGTTSCVSGAVLDSCAPGTPAASDATCDGIDNDCSGAVDEDYASIPTACGVGACAATGTTSCVSGAVLDSCAPGTPAASDATCDGIDNDCSGAVDEDYVAMPTACGVGACAATGTTSCVSGAVLDSCAPGTPAASDATCDGIDDDCSGAVDEDYVAVTSCFLPGACAAGNVPSSCSGGTETGCRTGTPAATTAAATGSTTTAAGRWTRTTRRCRRPAG